MIRLVLSSHYPLIRAGFRWVLSSKQNEVTILGEAENEADTVEHCITLNPAILLLQLARSFAFPDPAVQTITSRCPKLRIILLTEGEFPVHRSDLIDEGIFGCLTTQSSVHDVWIAISVVAAGGFWFPENHWDAKQDHPWKAMLKPGLTCREVEVVKLLAEGLVNDQIARRLGISERTARFHVENIMRKCGASNRASAATIAIRHGWIH